MIALFTTCYLRYSSFHSFLLCCRCRMRMLNLFKVTIKRLFITADSRFTINDPCTTPEPVEIHIMTFFRTFMNFFKSSENKFLYFLDGSFEKLFMFINRNLNNSSVISYDFSFLFLGLDLFIFYYEYLYRISFSIYNILLLISGFCFLASKDN